MVETVSVYEVEDAAHWQRHWAENAPAHEASGVRGKRLHFHPTDANRFIVIREFDNLDQARRYLASPERQQRMAAARVVQCTDYFPDES